MVWSSVPDPCGMLKETLLENIIQEALPVFPPLRHVCVHGLEMAVPLACSEQLLKEALWEGSRILKSCHNAAISRWMITIAFYYWEWQFKICEKIKTIKSVLEQNCLEWFCPEGRNMAIPNVFETAFKASTITILCKICLKTTGCTNSDILSSVLHIYYYLLGRHLKLTLVPNCALKYIWQIVRLNRHKYNLCRWVSESKARLSTYRHNIYKDQPKEII